MITYNRPSYTKLSLTRLLESCDETMRVWLWHNGSDIQTLKVVLPLAQHPRVHRFYHSPENKKLRDPTNWLWSNATGDFLAKVDDDCLVPQNWAVTLRQAHLDVPDFGVIGCWGYTKEDFLPEIANRKIQSFNGRHRLMRSCWLGGSGYLMKRKCLNTKGLLAPGQSFTDYCIRLASAGWINGWYYPFIYQEHMDDPRSPNSCLKTDEDFQRAIPLSARANGVTTLKAWQDQLSRSARLLQQASYDPRQYLGLGRIMNNSKKRIKRLFGITSQW